MTLGKTERRAVPGPGLWGHPPPPFSSLSFLEGKRGGTARTEPRGAERTPPPAPPLRRSSPWLLRRLQQKPTKSPSPRLSPGLPGRGEPRLPARPGPGPPRPVPSRAGGRQRLGRSLEGGQHVAAPGTPARPPGPPREETGHRRGDTVPGPSTGILRCAAAAAAPLPPGQPDTRSF